ncbi:MAG: hypothetical protein IH885_07435, partial [Myxococcales bacterium]|nr:hypothetical protein [Myxococcales bacterium]
MQIEPTEPPGGHDETRRGVRRVLLRGGALGAYTLLILLAVVWIDPLRAFHSFTVELGSLEPMGVRAALVTGPANWLRAMRQEPRVPELTIDIKLPHVQKLELKRRDALARGVLTQSPDDFVPAVIRSDDRSVRVKLRLKGDWT